MEHFSQQHLKAVPTEPEHLVRKTDLDHKIGVGIVTESLENGLSNVQLLSSNGQPDGEMVKNVMMQPTSAVLVVEQSGVVFGIRNNTPPVTDLEWIVDPPSSKNAQ